MSYIYKQLHVAVPALVQVAFAYCHFVPIDTLTANMVVFAYILGMITDICKRCSHEISLLSAMDQNQ